MSVVQRYLPLTRTVSMIQGEPEPVAEAALAELTRFIREGLKGMKRDFPGLKGNTYRPNVEFRVHHRVVDGLADAFDLLLPLDGGTKMLFLKTSSNPPWVAFFFNQAACSGYQSLMACLSIRLQTRTIHALWEPRTLKRLQTGRIVGRYGAVQFFVYNGHISPERYVSLVNDSGPWVFQQGGIPFPFEHPERYNAPRKADRFTLEELLHVLGGFGVRPCDDDFYRVSPQDPVYLIERIDHVEEVREGIRKTVSLEEIRNLFEGKVGNG